MPPLRLSSHHGVVALMIMIRKAPRKVLRMPILSFRIGVCQGSPEGSAHAPFKFPRWSVAPHLSFHGGVFAHHLSFHGGVFAPHLSFHSGVFAHTLTVYCGVNG